MIGLTTGWWFLIGAGFLEIIWAVGLKFTEGFSKPLPSAFVIVIMILSFWMLAQATKEIPVGTAYAVWSGLGAAGTAIAGILFLHEPAHWLRVGCIALILIGAAGLKLLPSSH